MFVKPGQRPDDPARPLVVRDPNGRILSALGDNVPETQFWFRRLRDGDVVDATPIPMAAEVVRVGSDSQVVEPVPEKIGELVADGAPHEAVFTGDHLAEPALNSHDEPSGQSPEGMHQETGTTS